MRLKTKLSVSLVFLFIIILFFGIVGLATINILNRDGEQVLKNNHESLVYSNNMLKLLDETQGASPDLEGFEENLSNQEHNITEPGEREATEQLRHAFALLKSNIGVAENYSNIRRSIIRIQEINENAILRKNARARITAENARRWLTLIFTILALISFTFIFNLPGILSDPISSLSEGITAIANKNYSKRIHLKQNDEFGQLAEAFNAMAGKLDEYENSNLAKIKFEKLRIETIINQMRDGILGLDEKRNILFLNAIAEKLLGLKESDAVGQFAPDLAKTNDLLRTLLSEQGEKGELKIFADNKESFFNKDVFNVTGNGDIIGKVYVLRNITPFHELNEAKTNFIATVSHELKTPIASIKMSAQLLNDPRIGILNAEQQGLTQGISDDVERLLRITAELLNLAQVETGNIQLRLQPTSPHNIIGQAIQATQFQAQQKHIEIKQSIPMNIGLVYADGEKTTWVLINLITNAIKFSPANAVIELSVEEKIDRIEFTVRDFGPGIESKYLPMLFDRYFRVPADGEKNGSGLGLAIAKEFIEAQDGKITATSSVGNGSCFGFVLKKVL